MMRLSTDWNIIAWRGRGDTDWRPFAGADCTIEDAQWEASRQKAETRVKCGNVIEYFEARMRGRK